MRLRTLEKAHMVVVAPELATEAPVDESAVAATREISALERDDAILRESDVKVCALRDAVQVHIAAAILLRVIRQNIEIAVVVEHSVHFVLEDVGTVAMLETDL